jgi:hypothetical protein
MRAAWGLALFGVLVAVGAGYLASMDFAHVASFNYYGSARPLGGDFWIFWAAGNLAANGQALAAYDPNALQATMSQISAVPFRPTPFFYPPWHLWLLAPFGDLPYFDAYLAYFAGGLLLFLSAIWRWAGYGSRCSCWASWVCGSTL